MWDLTQIFRQNLVILSNFKLLFFLWNKIKNILNLYSILKGLEDNDYKIVDKSIEGFYNSIKLTAYFGLNEEKD